MYGALYNSYLHRTCDSTILASLRIFTPPTPQRPFRTSLVISRTRVRTCNTGMTACTRKYVRTRKSQIWLPNRKFLYNAIPSYSSSVYVHQTWCLSVAHVNITMMPWQLYDAVIQGHSMACDPLQLYLRESFVAGLLP
jgi:hypothetical protein